MIKYELRCADCAHQFEAWFADSAGYDSQKKRGEILCPVCSSNDVGKAIMAPNIGVRENRRGAPANREQVTGEVRRALMEMRKEVESNFDYVGDKFVDEARAIHSGDAEERGIYGDATTEEAKDLIDEGIKVMPIPWVPPSDA